MKVYGVLVIILMAIAPVATAALDLNDYELVDGSLSTIELTPVIIPGTSALDNVSVTSAVYVSKTDAMSLVYLYQVKNENLTHELHRVTLTQFQGVGSSSIEYLSEAPGFVSGGADPLGYTIDAAPETLGFDVVYGDGAYSSIISVTSENREIDDTIILAQNGGQAYGTVVAPGAYIPEPATMVLLGLGAALIRKRK